MTQNAQPLTESEQPEIGDAMGDGYFAGQVRIDGQLFALIVAPKDDGDHDDIEWNSSYDNIEGELSYDDGLSNTRAMAEAGSELAKWAMGLRIGGHDDWYLPSQDELEIIYRNLKPGTHRNSCYARSGINLSAAEPTRPYTPDAPTQTNVEHFQADGDQALQEAWYWSSTQHASNPGYAWCQNFGSGRQSGSPKDNELRARAVRRVAI